MEKFKSIIKFTKENIYIVIIFLLIFNPLFTTVRATLNKNRININSEMIIKLMVADSIKTMEIEELRKEVDKMKK